MTDPTVVRRIVATTPIRIADVGGWTDTWFGGPGRVCNLAVGPGVRVNAELRRIARHPHDAVASGEVQVRIVAPDLGEDYVCGPSPDGSPAGGWPGRQPLLEQAVAAALDRQRVPDGSELRVHIASAVSAGASLGTSASVVVALLGATVPALGGDPCTLSDLARWAHEVETTRVGRQSGVQDQWAAAFGGAAVLDVEPFPVVDHHPIELTDETISALDARLVTVVFGVHDSSAVHREVIASLEAERASAGSRRQALDEVRDLAGQAAVALRVGDLDAWAAVLSDATEAQRRLHPSLVGEAHQVAIDLARRGGAAGWKVNGAGGAGGSLTVVASDAASAEDLARRFRATDAAWQVPRLAVAAGFDAAFEA